MHRPYARFVLPMALLGVLAFAPAASATGDTIAFTKSDPDIGGLDLYLIDSDGTNERLLVESEDYEAVPELSPDRSKVLFQRTPLTSWLPELWVVNVDGTGPTNLTNTPDQFEGPSFHWSPDGSKIVYDTDAPTKGVWVMNADGTGKDRVAAINDPVNEEWSPDGSRISYQNANRAIWVADADGQNAAKVWEYTTEDGRCVLSPALWSPDSSTLAFVFFTDDALKIHAMDPDGSGVHVFTPLASDVSETHPMWGSDGRLYFKADYPEGGGDIYSVAADGSDPRNLTAGIDDYVDGPLRESPNGQRLLFRRNGELWSMGVDGGSPALVSAEASNNYDW